MATDFIVQFYSWPVVIGSAILLVLGIVAKPPAPGRGVLGLGIKRLAFGYLGALAATALYALVESFYSGLWRVDSELISPDEFESWLPGWTLYSFFLLSPFVLLVMTVIGLPLFVLLSKSSFGSFVGIILIATFCSLTYSLYVFAFPSNIWCETNQLLCTTRALFDFGVPSILIALGFGFGARLPLFRESRPTSE